MLLSAVVVLLCIACPCVTAFGSLRLFGHLCPAATSGTSPRPTTPSGDRDRGRAFSSSFTSAVKHGRDQDRDHDRQLPYRPTKIPVSEHLRDHEAGRGHRTVLPRPSGWLLVCLLSLHALSWSPSAAMAESERDSFDRGGVEQVSTTLTGTTTVPARGVSSHASHARPQPSDDSVSQPAWLKFFPLSIDAVANADDSGFTSVTSVSSDSKRGDGSDEKSALMKASDFQRLG